jgi:hypothetical protein
LFEHGLFGKPVPTFPDHALADRDDASNLAVAAVACPISVAVPVVRIADGGGTAHGLAEVSIAKLYDLVVAAHNQLLLTIADVADD